MKSADNGLGDSLFEGEGDYGDDYEDDAEGETEEGDRKRIMREKYGAEDYEQDEEEDDDNYGEEEDEEEEEEGEEEEEEEEVNVGEEEGGEENQPPSSPVIKSSAASCVQAAIESGLSIAVTTKRGSPEIFKAAQEFVGQLSKRAVNNVSPTRRDEKEEKEEEEEEKGEEKKETELGESDEFRILEPILNKAAADENNNIEEKEEEKENNEEEKAEEKAEEKKEDSKDEGTTATETNGSLEPILNKAASEDEAKE